MKSLDERFEEIEALARRMGLDPFPILYEVVPRDIIWEVSSYGLPTRMSHWSFGRSFVHQKTYGEMGYSKIYELIINNNPSYAFLDDTNSDVVNMLICGHCAAHSDFFKHNACFSKSNRNMVNQAEQNAHTVDSFKEKYGIEVVEDWMDVAFALDRHIDWSMGENRQRYPQQEHVFRKVDPLPYSDLFGEDQKPRVVHEVKNKDFPPHKERDLIWFMATYAQMLPWQRELMSMIRSESFYFYPQFMTKIMNEGWACVDPSTLVFTEEGLRSMKDVVDEKIQVVSDGEASRRVYDRNIIRNQPTVTMRTRRGFSITGSVTHRVLLADGTFRRLDELVAGDIVSISGGSGMWPSKEVRVSWSKPKAFSLVDAAKKAETSVWTLMRRKSGKHCSCSSSCKIDAAIEEYKSHPSAVGISKRRSVIVPTVVGEDFASFLGYLVGDGHISLAKRVIGLTTADVEQARSFSFLVRRLFGIVPRTIRDGKRFRVLFHSLTVSDYLVQAIGLTTGPSARQKTIPDVILKSPENVVSKFLRAYFDCDGCACKQGVILSTSSDFLAERVQILLLNWGILSRRHKQAHEIWNIHVSGISAARFSEKIGFGLSRKQKKLDRYVKNHEWFKKEKYEDEVVGIEHGTGDVYDISVRDTHRYAAAGFVNHNSFWHAELMLNYEDLTASEHMDFAKAHAGVVSAGPPGSLNPYYVGFRIFGDIKKRWDEYYEAGQKDAAFLKFGDVDKYDEEGNVVMSKMTGMQKLLQVRAEDDDVSFVYNYLTMDLAQDMKLYRYGMRGVSENPDEDDIILKSRDMAKIIEAMTSRLHNYGAPPIYIDEVSDSDRSLILIHDESDKIPLDEMYTKETLKYIARTWGHKVVLRSRDRFGKVLSYVIDGYSEVKSREAEDESIVEVSI